MNPPPDRLAYCLANGSRWVGTYGPGASKAQIEADMREVATVARARVYQVKGLPHNDLAG